eukprot:GHUV01041186.1.p1 GENE.GHUV01041186.1~~GHUV01041186.1.p1  ORF type:complete len:203 (+),score=52.72 GHUV01041186.1:845-1453(+)
MQTIEGSLCCCEDIWKERLTDSSSQSDRSEQSDVMMPDQQPASEQSPASENRAINTSVAASSDAAVSVHASTDAVGSTSAADACAPAAAAAADDAAAAAKPPRVFKMSDEFLMFKFKIEMCSRKDRHDWKICPYAHPGEVARRRHPRGYTAVLCPAKTAVSHGCTDSTLNACDQAVAATPRTAGASLKQGGLSVSIRFLPNS